MGLDSLWRVKQGDGYVEVELPEKDRAIVEAHPLCGGMLSAHGLDSFRGKVYSDLVERVTGESLYQDYIAPDRVAKMADQLERTSYAAGVLKIGGRWVFGEEGYRNLQVVFRVYANNGAGLVGWW